MRTLSGLVILAASIVLLIMGIDQGFADGTCAGTGDGFSCSGNPPMVAGSVGLVGSVLLLSFGGELARKRRAKAVRRARSPRPSTRP